ncbi:MAG: LacI family transcriptional regulator [Treponema sp.]|jgi:LacI family transcriptional regulator|nr:LacI family transcriptional regulator [Treponema sp.]
MSITQKDIARDLGVSIITVSRALNNTGYVSPRLRKRINEYVKKKSYMPNRASQVLVRNKTRIISLFSSVNPDYFWGDIRKGTELAGMQIRHFNYEVHFHTIPDFDSGRFKKILKNEIKNGLSAAGFINQWFYDMNALAGMLEAEGIPYIFYNVDHSGTGRLCYIGPDYHAAGRLAANYIGKALELKKGGTVVAVSMVEDTEKYPILLPDINSMRLTGFMEKLKQDYPAVCCVNENMYAKSKRGYSGQVRSILRSYRDKADAFYMIPSFNTVFIEEMERADCRRAITLLHDIDGSSLRGLESGALTAAVYQNPVLQGYTAVKTLEKILESRERSVLPDIEVGHALVFRENTSFLKNQFLLSE